MRFYLNLVRKRIPHPSRRPHTPVRGQNEIPHTSCLLPICRQIAASGRVRVNPTGAQTPENRERARESGPSGGEVGKNGPSGEWTGSRENRASGERGGSRKNRAQNQRNVDRRPIRGRQSVPWTTRGTRGTPCPAVSVPRRACVRGTSRRRRGARRPAASLRPSARRRPRSAGR
jgi:hypothetical protein